MNKSLRTPDTTPAPGRLFGRFASLLEDVRVRRNQSGLAGQIAAYPAMRSVATLVLPH